MDRSAVNDSFKYARKRPRPNTIHHILDGTGYYADSVLARTFNALCEHPYGLTSAEIVDLIYADDPTGGPLTACRSVRANVFRFNLLARRQRLGLRIHVRIGDRPGRGAGRFCLWVVRE